MKTKEDVLAKLNTLPEEEPDEFDIVAIQEAEKENDDSLMPLDEVKSVLDYSGKLNIRIPKSLHRKLSLAAKSDGVSLNQYIIYKLAN